MKTDNIQQKAAETLTEKTKTITINVNRPNLLQRYGILPKQRHFIVGPVTLGNLMRISGVLLQIGYNPDAQSFFNEGLKAATQAPKMAYVVAIALTNQKKEPSAALVRWLLDNLTAAELFNLMLMVLAQLDLKSFMSAIISVTGMSLLKQGGTKAPGDISED